MFQIFTRLFLFVYLEVDFQIKIYPYGIKKTFNEELLNVWKI